jgi:ABC-type amino acid transport system permease subunit
LQLDIIVPVVMSCALLWWVSRGMSWTTRLAVTAITLALIIGILLFERSGFFNRPNRDAHDIGGATN